jgi:hypothetical protein
MVSSDELKKADRRHEEAQGRSQRPEGLGRHMALFTDGLVSGMEDLTAQDTQLIERGKRRGIDVTQKLALAQEELALEITTLLSGSRRAEAGVLARRNPDRQRGGDAGAQTLAHVPNFRDGVRRCVLEPIERPVRGETETSSTSVSGWAYERLLLMGSGSSGPDSAPQGTSGSQLRAASLPNGTYYVAMTWTNGKMKKAHHRHRRRRLQRQEARSW